MGFKKIQRGFGFLHVFGLVVLIAVTPIANAQTYKCVVGGKSVYSDSPCSQTAARVDADTDRVTEQQRQERASLSSKERQQRNAIERRDEAEYQARNRALAAQEAAESRAAAQAAMVKSDMCTNLRNRISYNQQSIARYQALGWQQQITQAENELRGNRSAYDSECRK